MRTLLAALFSIGLVAVLPGAAPAKKPQTGALHTALAPSAALGEDIDYTVYLPHGYDASDRRYPVLYLLHGRGDTMRAWTEVKSDLDRLIEAGTVPPVIAVLPDAPWSERGHYYVDSQHDAGRPVETALTRDLVAHVDATYRTAAHRLARLVGGYSMGGAGALRYSSEYDLFGHALVLSPAVYTPLPPEDSSAREFGAYGRGSDLFDEAIYEELNYPAVLPGMDPDLPVRMFIAVGDDEWAGPQPEHDLDFEAAKLYNTVRRSPAIAAEFRVLNGGHGWDVWRPAFVAGLTHLGRTLSVDQPMGLPGELYGSEVSDRAGGVAAHTDGSVTLALGGKDATVTRVGQWSKTFGTASNERLYGVVAMPDGGIITGGYSGSDMYLARLSAMGELLWEKTFGDPAQPDRIYGLTAAPDGVYVTGYTGYEKQVVVAQISDAGEIVWSQTFGWETEDKGFAVVASSDGVYVAGTFGLARYGSDGEQQWVQRDVMLAGVAVSPSGDAVATGTDLTVVAYAPSGRALWRKTFGNGTGAEVVALPDGFAVLGFSSSVWTVPAGGQDVVVLRLDRRGSLVSAVQFGSPGDDGADPFLEENLYATHANGKLLVTGLTRGDQVFFGELAL